MSSPIKPGSAGSAKKLAEKAGWRANISQYFGLAAMLLGATFFVVFLAQSGFFNLLNSSPDKERPKISDPAIVSGSQSVISGVDKDNQPYEITSLTGVQDKFSANLIHLETVKGVFHRPDKKLINLVSKTAIYDSKTKAMTLQGDVVFEEPGRYHATMDNAAVNLDDKSLVSQSPVRVDIAAGTVEADSLEIIDNGKRALFKGHVKARFGIDE